MKKSPGTAALLFFCYALRAQAPAPVPLAKEAHHKLILQNQFLRVFRVSIPVSDAAALHQHDQPYIAVSLGPAEFTNAVAGKPEAHVKLFDGQIGFSPGHFAHAVRIDAAIPFNNVTIELLAAETNPRNLCEKIVAGDVGECDLGRDETSAPIRTRPLMETDQIRVDSVTVQRGEFMDAVHPRPGLLIDVSGAPLQVARVPGRSTETLHSGEIIWLPVGGEPKFTVEDGIESRLILITFKKSETAAQP
jgi:hypothetical protein